MLYMLSNMQPELKKKKLNQISLHPPSITQTVQNFLQLTE